MVGVKIRGRRQENLLRAEREIENDAILVTHDAGLLDGSIAGLQVEDWF